MRPAPYTDLEEAGVIGKGRAGEEIVSHAGDGLGMGPGRAHGWRNAREGEPWVGPEFPWNWALLGCVLGCLFFWALVIWEIPRVF